MQPTTITANHFFDNDGGAVTIRYAPAGSRGSILAGQVSQTHFSGLLLPPQAPDMEIKFPSFQPLDVEIKFPSFQPPDVEIRLYRSHGCRTQRGASHLHFGLAMIASTDEKFPMLLPLIYQRRFQSKFLFHPREAAGNACFCLSSTNEDSNPSFFFTLERLRGTHASLHRAPGSLRTLKDQTPRYDYLKPHELS